MVKYPEVGSVKSRLAKSIGSEAATDLYRAFILDTLSTLHALEIPFHIAIFPPATQDRFIEWLGRSYQVFGQNGADLGERLHNGFMTMFEEKYEQVIALASDSPGLPIDILSKAASSLRSQNAVLGPALDGGYYLIGFSRDTYIPSAFEGISWGTEAVFRETLSQLKSISNRVHILPKWMDIDTETDLRKFYEAYQMQPSTAPRTLSYIRSHPDILGAHS
ncbi:glycosyltransferase [Candidatus Thorarchaeota archaeon]|nr:MAG: glycosyltransferase [Candidatus Thorarchaeota archaeon]